jgi:hypothetical protein
MSDGRGMPKISTLEILREASQQLAKRRAEYGFGICAAIDKVCIHHGLDVFKDGDRVGFVVRDLFRPTDEEAREYGHSRVYWGSEQVPDEYAPRKERAIELRAKKFRLLVLAFAIAMCEAGDL